MNRIHRICPAVFLRSYFVHFVNSVGQQKAMRGKSHGQASLPSAELPASGSRGSIGLLRRSSQPGGSPALSFLVRIRLGFTKSTVAAVCFVVRMRHRNGRFRCIAKMQRELSRGRRAGFLLHVRVENGLPLSVVLFPHRGGVERAGLIFPAVCAL